MNLPYRFAAPLLTACVLAACASSTPAPVLLTLPPALATAPAPAIGPTASAPSPVLAVRRLNLPEYLVARRVRFRADASTLAEWPNTYWAERIEIGMSREFVTALRQQLPGWTLCDGQCGDQTPAFSLQIDFAPLDFVRATQKLQARARMSVTDGGAPPKVLRTAEAGFDIAAGADTAQAQAQAMAELVRQAAAVAAPLVQSARP
jgi:uncharacterized lipoprotein YmbA